MFHFITNLRIFSYNTHLTMNSDAVIVIPPLIRTEINSNNIWQARDKPMLENDKIKYKTCKTCLCAHRNSAACKQWCEGFLTLTVLLYLIWKYFVWGGMMWRFITSPEIFISFCRTKENQNHVTIYESNWKHIAKKVY